MMYSKFVLVLDMKTSAFKLLRFWLSVTEDLLIMNLASLALNKRNYISLLLLMKCFCISVRRI